MSKKALLVTFQTTVRVSVPIPDDNDEAVIALACDKLRRHFNDYFDGSSGNVTDIAEDKECPYDPERDEV